MLIHKLVLAVLSFAVIGAQFALDPHGSAVAQSTDGDEDKYCRRATFECKKDGVQFTSDYICEDDDERAESNAQTNAWIKAMHHPCNGPGAGWKIHDFEVCDPNTHCGIAARAEDSVAPKTAAGGSGCWKVSFTACFCKCGQCNSFEHTAEGDTYCSALAKARKVVCRMAPECGCVRWCRHCIVQRPCP